MRFAVVYSKKDVAGVNIANELASFFLPHCPIIEVSKESVHSEEVEDDEKLKETDFIIFASRHVSKAGVPSLALHAPGNFRNNDYGGKAGKVSTSSALAMKFLFERLNINAKEAGITHEVTLEATHHGPLVKKPCCFIEVGSNEEAWNDKSLARIVAKTISDFQNFSEWQKKAKKEKVKIALGIGGGHYCNSFNKIQLNNPLYAIAHIIPEHTLPISENMIHEALEKTFEHLDLAIVDWKGCGNAENRDKVTALLNRLGIEYERSERIEK